MKITLTLDDLECHDNQYDRLAALCGDCNGSVHHSLKVETKALRSVYILIVYVRRSAIVDKTCF